MYGHPGHERSVHVAVGEIEYLTALRSLTLECQALHGPLCCSSLEYLELIGAGGYMMLVSSLLNILIFFQKLLP